MDARRGVTLIELLVVILIIAPSVRAADLMPEIIANVRANEELYRRIEVVAIHTHRPGNPLLGFPKSFWKASDATYRLVFQNNRFLFKTDRETDVSKVGMEKSGVLSGFDGEFTRIALKNSICNLSEGRLDDSKTFILLPHTMPLRKPPSLANFPLSVYLSGTKAIRPYPRYKEANLTLEMVKEEMKDGLRTFQIAGKIWWEPSNKSWETDYSYLRLWLAPDRNYLPVRLEWDKPFYIKGHPQVVARLDDLREIAPGVWFPFHYHCDTYDPNWYEKDKSIVLADMEDLVVEKAELNPSYDDKLFRDIPFPDGAHVYVVKNGKSIRDYLQGGRRFAAAPAPRRSYWGVGLAATVVLAGGGLWAYSRRSRRFRMLEPA